MNLKSLYSNLLTGVIVLSATVACDKHDSMDDNVIVGKMAPHVYWELGTSSVAAGDSIPFTAQYYTTSSTDIDRMEVWYSVLKTELRTVACPWTTTFKYSITSTKESLQRVSEKVAHFPHRADTWNSTIRAYAVGYKFPTSNTLTSTSWVKPVAFASVDSVQMKSYFGEQFMQHFKDSLYTMMKVKDFQNMYLGLNLVDNFKPYLDSVFNANTNQYEYYFPKDASGNRPVPTDIANIYQTIPFADLIFNNKNNNYEVEFIRYYTLKPVFKVIDKDQISGVTSINNDIVLN